MGFVVEVVDGPAGNVFRATFNPPAIQNTERGDAVERGLHAAGAGSLVGAERGVHPDIDTLRELLAELPVVVFEVEDAERRSC